MSDFENRLGKNAKTRLRWAERQGLTAFRLYDLDIPEWPVAVDWYAGWLHVMEYPSRRQARSGQFGALRAEVLRVCQVVLEVAPDRIFTKTHEPKPWGRAQYQRASARGATVVVSENGLSFDCNLSDYLDTGLFLDHRLTRERVRKEAQGKRVLNLFSYTGAFTVAAAAGGATHTVSVDLSQAYCDWAGRNLELNHLDRSSRNELVRADALAWVGSAQGPYDLIVLDPPSHSVSKKMTRSFNVVRDHRPLIDAALQLLAAGGTLYFSTNYLGFELDPSLEAEEVTRLPPDFRRTVHRCWRLRR